MAHAVLDTLVAAETPEGILLELRPAGLSARFYAFLLDWLIRLVIAYAAAIAAAFMGGFGTAFWLLLYFLLEWFYPVVFELSRSGATPGKSVVGIKVVMDNGLPDHAGRLVHAQPVARRRFPAVRVRRGHRLDAAAQGLQALGRSRGRDARRPPTAAPAEAEARRRGARDSRCVPLAPRDQAAIVALAARAPTLTGERLDELAALAAAVSGDGGKAGPNVTRRVLGVAQWAMGKRA